MAYEVVPQSEFKHLKNKSMPTKKYPKQDPKLVASKQAWEVKYLAKRFRTTMEKVREVMQALGTPNKPERSRKQIVAQLRANGHKENLAVKEKDFKPVKEDNTK